MKRAAIVGLLFAPVVVVAACGDGQDKTLDVPARSTNPVLDASDFLDAGDDATEADAPSDAPGDADVDADTGLPVGAFAIATGAGPHTDPAVGYGDHTCALTGADKSVYCWGANDHGQIGTGETFDAGLAVPDDVALATRLTTDEQGQPFGGADEIALAAWHSCARRANDLYCWGQRFSGAQAEPPFALNPDRTKPRLIGGIPIARVVAGGPHTCIVKATGKVACFGHSYFNELGRPNLNDAPCTAPIFYDYPGFPVGLPHSCAGEVVETTTALSGIQAFAAGELHNCVVVDTHVKCWGTNASGQLGNPLAAAAELNPVEVIADPNAMTALAGASVVASGGGKHSCALVGSKVNCWGTNASGELGVDPAVTLQRANAAEVAGLPAVVRIGVGDGVSCAVTAEGAVWCWGADDVGQLGDGAPKASSFAPVQVKGPGNVGTLANVKAVAPGRRHVCALLSDETVFCWGKNDRGQLGDGTKVDSLYPVKVSGLPAR